MDEHVLVIGGTLWDAKGKPTAGLEQHTSNPGLIHMSRGGGGRNVAENLGRLGADVVFISAVGDDEIGHRLIEQTQSADVNTEYMRSSQCAYRLLYGLSECRRIAGCRN